jgi:hypothetical protein
VPVVLVTVLVFHEGRRLSHPSATSRDRISRWRVR